MDFNPTGAFKIFTLGFTIFPIFFILFFVVFFIIIIKGLRQWNHNNHQPVLTVDAKVVSKRENVSHHSHNMNDNMSSTTSTDYYTTFEFQSGDRLELNISGREYGMLAEGDLGKLTFQGTRFKAFERI